MSYASVLNLITIIIMPFYPLAKCKLTYRIEPDDFATAFEYARHPTSQGKSKYEPLKNCNALYGNLQHPRQSTANITYYGQNITDFA